MVTKSMASCSARRTYDRFGDWMHRDDRNVVVAHDDRYFLSSLPLSRLTPRQWLLAVRRHWGVEATHQILDVAFDEDDRPWIETNPRATVVVIVLRRIAYTLLAL